MKQNSLSEGWRIWRCCRIGGEESRFGRCANSAVSRAGLLWALKFLLATLQAQSCLIRGMATNRSVKTSMGLLSHSEVWADESKGIVWNWAPWFYFHFIF